MDAMSRAIVAAVLAILLPACGGSSLHTPDGGGGMDGGSNDTNPIVRVDAGTPTTLATSASTYAIAVDDTHVYWTDLVARTVMKVPREGGTPVTLASDQERAFVLAVDATHAYWTVDAQPGPGTVMKVPLAGGTPVTVASGQMGPTGIAVDGTTGSWGCRAGRHGRLLGGG